MFCALQKIWRCYLSPSEKKFYSTLREKNCIHHAYVDDVALPLSLQKFILGICILQKIIGISDNIPLRETSLLVLTPSENLIYLGGVDIKWNGPVLAPKGKSKTPYPSLISDTVPFWWRGCSFMLSWAMCLKMSLEVSVECYFICITKHSPPNILLANELLVIEYCFYHLFVAVYSFFLLHHCPPSPWCGPSSWSVQCLCV